jgi:hypothetical protein
MIDIIVHFEVDDRPTEPEQIADEYLAEMLEHTGALIRQEVARKLAEVRCPEHETPPRVTVTGMYATDTEQMELVYHVDSCCQQLLLRTVAALNH